MRGQGVLSLSARGNLQSWPASNIGTRSATLVWGWPLQLRHTQGRSHASHVIPKDYYNKRNSPNIFPGLRKAAGTLPAYMMSLGWKEKTPVLRKCLEPRQKQR